MVRWPLRANDDAYHPNFVDQLHFHATKPILLLDLRFIYDYNPLSLHLTTVSIIPHFGNLL
jgi:hypothetical protein